MRLSYLQVAILLATGLQHRDVDAISAELDLPVNQVLAFFNKVSVRYPLLHDMILIIRIVLYSIYLVVYVLVPPIQTY
jgi:Possible tRNA binding domain